MDLYDVLPTPFGLVRAGVAPDHPKIKSVTRRYEKTAADPGFRFFGGVEFGSDVSRAELFERYHAVIYAIGTSADNRLGIAGEDRPGSHAATEFVAWYNGHPDYADREFDLSTRRAVVIGNGNVAIDVARMLVLDPDDISVTDTADHAIAALAAAQV
ncbi:MAG: NADP oxidoreductase, partial [Actinobacteria bacterium]|nr:NADP oxidoreductase [Actinomycetota bacterium]